MLAPFLVLTSVLRLTSGFWNPGKGEGIHIVGRKHVVGMVENGRDGIGMAGMFRVEVVFVMVGMDGMG
jgi:hypothetical protein